MKLTNASKETITILSNKELIDFNQDALVGEAISPFRWGINVSTEPATERSFHFTAEVRHSPISCQILHIQLNIGVGIAAEGRS